MTPVYRLVTGLLLFAAVSCSAAHAQFFYVNDSTVPLLIDSQKIQVKYAEGFSPSNESIFVFDRVNGVLQDTFNVGGFYTYELQSGAAYDEFLDSVQALEAVSLVEPYYLIAEGYPHLPGDQFIVAFKNTVSFAEIDSINNAHHVVVDRQRIGREKSFVLKNTDSSGMRILDLANMYNEMDQVEYATPDFHANITAFSYQLYDNFHVNQDHIKRVIGEFNVASVWDFAGLYDTIIVAVVDMGCVPHEDLPADRMLLGYDATRGLNHAEPGDSCYHGIALAGIIAASHTTDSTDGLESSSGIISLNPHVVIMPVKIFGNNCSSHAVTDSQTADGIDWAWEHGADIIVNAWGYNPPYDYPRPDVDTAIINAATLGRDGLGCPVIFAAGNNGDVVTYPARRSECLAVGAVDLDETRWNYSCRSLALDLVAPAGDVCLTGDFWTLDQMGYLGANPLIRSSCGQPVPVWECPPTGILKDNDPNYNCRFGGTSSASPIVGGVASLVLAKDPTLTKDEVYEILKGSAYVDSELIWEVPDFEYGYGRVDAFRAILSLARGDCNNSGSINFTDFTVLVNHLFVTFQPLFPSSLLGDVNCDGQVNQTDVTLLFNHLFVTFEPLAIPCFEYGD